MQIGIQCGKFVYNNGGIRYGKSMSNLKSASLYFPIIGLDNGWVDASKGK